MGIDPTRGFVAFPRGLTDWEWYTEPNTARLFFHLLLTATAPDVRTIRPDGFGTPAINQLDNHPDRAEIQRYHAQ